MDIYFEQDLSRNGIDESYFDFLGIGKKRREKALDKIEELQLQDLESRFPDRETFSEQQNYVKQLIFERDKIAQDRSKAKSKKTRENLDSRLRAYNSFIKDYQYTLSKLKIEEEREAAIQQKKQREIIVSPTPIVTSQGGDIVLPKKQVFVQETSQDAIETQVSPLLAKEDGILPTSQTKETTNLNQPSAPTKKTNWMLYGGIGLAIVLGIFLIRKNN
jgi:hypothetical protein